MTRRQSRAPSGLFLCLTLALAALSGDVLAQASNPMVLWTVTVNPPWSSQFTVTIPVPQSGGTNTANTAGGATVSVTTRPSANNGSFNIKNFQFLIVQPSNFLLSDQTSANCTGSSGDIGANFTTNSAGTIFTSVFTFSATCVITYTSPIGCASTHTTTTQCPQTFTFNGNYQAVTPSAGGTAVLSQGSATVMRFGATVPITASGVVIALNDRIVTGPSSSVTITLNDGHNSQVILLSNTDFTLTKIAPTFIEQASGLIHAILSGLNCAGDCFEIRSVSAVAGVRGTDFTNNVAQSGATATTTTTVNSGTVNQIDLQGNVTPLTAGQTGQLSVPPPLLVAAVLPASRSVATSQLATAFASIFNAGPSNAVACTISLPANFQADFFYETTDPATNTPNGNPGTPVTIPPGQSQTFLFGITPATAFTPTNLQLNYTCNGSDMVAPLVGINTLLLSSSSTGTPDVITVGLTPSNDGYSHTGGPVGTGLFVIASSNIGISASLTARARVSNSSLPLTTTVCQTNPSNGQCLSPPAATATATINNNQNTTWSAFLAASGPVPPDPANNRVFFEFVDSAGVVRGSTSTAVTTQ